ncbi:MAG: phospho-N-acetylmuramoyl-pentapeptide-transferase [Clostridiales bacterium]|nr:phospho-N-acetylmuramoyl-pentapeptide-transferase [Clostridiales bacterium]
MLRMLLALILSAVLVLLTGPKVIPALRKMKFGQTIYDLGPQSHKQKQGTPTMGGVMIAFGVVVAALVALLINYKGGVSFMLGLLAISLLSMAVGFADDYIKVVKKRSLGLTPWQKIAGQVFTAVAFSAFCYFHPQVGSKVIIPFANIEWDLGIFYIPLLSLTIIFIVNSANLNDGLDGLLSGVAGVGGMAWASIALFCTLAVVETNPEYAGNLQSISVFGMAVMGACIGFLRFNHHPATVFMGDTGSMLLGGATVGMAMLLRQPFLLLLIAFTMVASSVSVIIQRYYYKATRKIFGEPRRLFKMTPIHHHFELSGMSENKVVVMYVIVTVVLSLIALWSLQGLQLV